MNAYVSNHYTKHPLFLAYIIFLKRNLTFRIIKVLPVANVISIRNLQVKGLKILIKLKFKYEMWISINMHFNTMCHGLFVYPGDTLIYNYSLDRSRLETDVRSMNGIEKASVKYLED